MNTIVQPLTSLAQHMAWCALTLLFVFVSGCAEITSETSENSSWVPASAEIEQSLGVSTWHIETLEGGATRILGFNRSDTQLSEMRISAHVFNQAEALMYELHVTQYSRIVMTENGVIENTLSIEPRGDEWFNAMISVQSAAKSSSVNKSLISCIGLEAGVEACSIVNDWTNGSYGHPADYFSVCMAVYKCLQEQRASSYSNNYLASSSNSWSSNSGYGSSYNNGYSDYGNGYNNGYSDYGNGYNNGYSDYGNGYNNGYSDYNSDGSGWYDEW